MNSTIFLAYRNLLLGCGLTLALTATPCLADSDYAAEATWLNHLEQGVYNGHWINPGVFDEEDNFSITDAALQKVANFLSRRKQSVDLSEQSMRFATDLGDNQFHVRMTYNF